MEETNGNGELTAERTYQIGTVSSLTGIDAHTIRAWERRYGAIKPMRSAKGRRLYSDETVERLQLLKGLVDCSEAISTIAQLSDEELRGRLEKIAEHEGQAVRLGTAEDQPSRRPVVALFAPTLAVQIGANAVAMADFDVRASEADADAFLDTIRQEPVDIAVFELESVNDGAIGLVQACRSTPGGPQVVVLYRFTSRGALARLARAGAALVRTPIRLESLRRLFQDQIMIRRARSRRFGQPAQRAADPSTDHPLKQGDPLPRRFDDEQLAKLLELSTAVDCECPNHLSSLIAGLVAFESYSRECESRDEADAAQHRRLAEGTGEARARMEALLVELCEYEGIAI